MRLFLWLGFLLGGLGQLSRILGQVPEAPAGDAEEIRELTRGPVPAWVEESAWEKSTAAHPGHPAEVLLNDAQAALREDGNDYYFRSVTRILNREGVKQNAEQSVTFSPEHERVIWHVLRIHRGGETIDQLPKVRFKRLQRELGLEGQVYDGRITAVAVLEDIRVGDVLEFAYTRLNTNPLFKGYPGFRMSVGSGYPTKRQNIVVRMPAALAKPHWYFFLPPDTQGLPEEIFSPARLRGALRDGSTEEEHVYRWEVRDIPAVPFDWAMSGEAAPYFPQVRCTTFAWWNRVAEWALPLFETGEALPPEVEAMAAKWRELPDPRARLRAAVDWVQGDVRYFSMAFGQHNVKPRPMAAVAATRFGDCKDKSVLLAQLLRALGLPAWPALVNTYSEHLVRWGGPDVHAFNHAIVAYELDGELRWVDPTIRQPAGRAGDWELPAGYSPALILRADEQRLTELPASDLESIDCDTVDRFTIDAASGVADLVSEVVLRGLQADFYRMSLDEMTDDQRAKNWFNYMARFYPKIEEVEPPTVADDRRANVVTVRARYRVPDAIATEQGVRCVNFYAYAIRTLLENPESRRRHWPMALPFGRSLRHRIEVELPEEVAAFARPFLARTPGFEFRSDKSASGRRATTQHELRFTGRYVPPARMKIFARTVEEVLGELAVGIRFDPVKPAAPAANAPSQP